MTVISQGSDCYVTTGDDTPPDLSLDQAVLHQDTTYLAKFPTGFADFSTLASAALTFHVVGAVSAGMHLRLQLIGDDFAMSRVTAATLPALTGTPVDITLGALAAGDTFSFSYVALMQTVANQSATWRGVVITRMDSGAAVPVWTFDAADPLMLPTQEVTLALQPPKPSKLSPGSGATSASPRYVSANQFVLRVLDYAVSLADQQIVAMRVQWSATNSFAGTLLADDRQAVTEPAFDMTKTQRVTSADGHTTSGSATVTAADGNFTQMDVGAAITGTNIPANTTILAVASSTSLTLSANATGTSTTVVLTIGSGFSLSSHILGAYWRCFLQGSDGVWSDPSDPAFTRPQGLAVLGIDYPPAAPGNVVPETDPLVSWTFAGVQAYYRVTRTTKADPLTILGDTEWQPGTVSAVVLGYPVPDDQTYIDTVYVQDNKTRENLPDAPAYSVQSQEWSAQPAKDLQAPDMKPLFLLGDATPFPVIQWALNGGDDKKFRVRRDSEVISGLLDPAKVKIGTDDQGKPLYQWIDFTAAPNTNSTYRVQVVTGSKGRATSDPQSIVTATSTAGLANPTTGQVCRFRNFNPGKWVMPTPNTQVWAPFERSSRWRRVRGTRLGYRMQGCQGEMWPDEIEPAAKAYHENFLAMIDSDADVVLWTPHETVQVQIDMDPGSTPIGHPYLGRTATFDLVQTGDSFLSGNQGLDDGGATVVTLIDVDTYPAGMSDGSAIPTDALITGNTGSIVAEADAAMHDSALGMRFPNTSGGAFIEITTSALTNSFSIYCKGVSALPSSSKSMFRWSDSGSTIAGVYLGSSGAFKINDATNNYDTTTVQIDVNQPFRLDVSQSWAAGVSHVEASLWVKGNLEGTDPDSTITADIPAATAPGGDVQLGAVATPGYVMDLDDIRVANYSSALFEPLGDPPPPPEPIDGIGLWPGFADQTTAWLTAYVQGVSGSITDTDLIGCQVATDAGFSSIVYTGAAAVRDDLSFRRWVATGLSASTTYYWRITKNGTPIYSTGQIKTALGLGSTGTVKIASAGCQRRNPANSACFDDMVTWGADRFVHHGDRGYPSDLDTTTASHGRNHADTTIDPASQTALLKMAQAYIVSDHDDNGTSASNLAVFNDPITMASLATWQQVVPMPIADTENPIHGRYTFMREGKWRHIYLDNRTIDRSDVRENGKLPNDAGTTWLGATQEAWLQAQAVAAAAAHEVLVMWCDAALLGTTPTNYKGADGIAATFSDKAPSYQVSRDRVFLMLHGIMGANVIWLFSDSHGLQWEGGSAGVTGAFNAYSWVFVCSGPLHQTLHVHYQNAYKGIWPPDAKGDSETGGDDAGKDRNAMQYNRVILQWDGTHVNLTIASRDCTPGNPEGISGGVPATVNTLTATYTP